MWKKINKQIQNFKNCQNYILWSLSMAIPILLDTSIMIIFQQETSKLLNYTQSYSNFCAKKQVLR